MFQTKKKANGRYAFGTTPSGGGSPTGPAGGDLGGTYPNPTVLNLAHNTTLTTKGDLLVSTGVSSVRIGVGADGDVLTADSAQPDGIKWAPAAATADLVSATLATPSGATASTTVDSAGVTFDVPLSGTDATDHIWAFGVGGTPIISIQATGDGSGSPTLPFVDIEGNLTINHTGVGQALNITNSLTPTINSTDYGGAVSFTVGNPAANNGSTFVGLFADVGSVLLTHDMSGSFIGMQNQASVNIGVGHTAGKVFGGQYTAQNVGAGSLGLAVAFEGIVANSTGTLTEGDVIHIRNGSNSGGTFTAQYGIKMDNMTAATSNYGLYIQGASTYAIWSDSTTSISRFDGPVELEGSTSGHFQMTAAAATTTYAVKWPSAQGGAGTFLQNDGAGILSWAAGGSGVTSINADATAAQLLSTGTAGTDFAIVDAGGGSHVFNLPTASAVNTGKLSNTDWSTFNGKQDALTFGNLTDAGTDGIIITGGTGAVIGVGTSIAQHVADATNNGYLSSTDWSTFNGKGTGSVTTVSVVSANGFAGTVATATTTPAITLTTTITGILQGNGTAISAASTTGSGNVVLSTSPVLTTPNIGSATGSISGNAGTATALQTARTINGVSFDGTANITVTAAAGTLTGTTLNATVVNSSLTSVGTIATGVWNGTAVDVAHGGTGDTSLTAYAPLFGGTTSTNPVQSGTAGTAGQVLTSNGPGVLPTFQTVGTFAPVMFSLATASITNTVSGDQTITSFTIPANTLLANGGFIVKLYCRTNNGGTNPTFILKGTFGGTLFATWFSATGSANRILELTITNNASTSSQIGSSATGGAVIDINQLGAIDTTVDQPFNIVGNMNAATSDSTIVVYNLEVFSLPAT